MRLSEIKNVLPQLQDVAFRLEDGTFVPEHFHVTEVGIVSKDFIDCGGTIRHERVANFQLWNADDFEHRLKPEKLLAIIGLSESRLGMGDLEIEVEFQRDTIGKYDLDFDGKTFLLKPKTTACLAMDACNIPASQPAVNACSPQSGCCA